MGQMIHYYLIIYPVNPNIHKCLSKSGICPIFKVVGSFCGVQDDLGVKLLKRDHPWLQ